MGIDLDAKDHGERGLADPAHAVRTIAERADNMGLTSGLLVARSRGGASRCGAEIVERDGRRLARWRLRNGQPRSAEVVDCKDGKLRVRGRSRSYMARYRDGRGEMVQVATGCKDEVAAHAVLAQLERRAELIRAGVLSGDEATVADHAGQPLSQHLDAYERHLRAKDCNPRRIRMVRRRLERLARECRLTTLNKLSAGPIERWLVEHAHLGMSAATRNTYRESAVCFGNWCRRTRRHAKDDAHKRALVERSS